MHREVFRHVEDGFEDFDVVALDFAALEQDRRVERLKGDLDVGEGCPKQRQQLVAGDWIALLKLRITIARVRLGTDSADNPLARVAREVQDQVTDAV